MSDSFADEDVSIGFVDLPPDPSVANAIGGHHSLETALADLVDNSIDAGASRVAIRFLDGPRGVIAVRISDNGSGMSHDQLRSAMTIGHRRQYGGADLGHFGMGLKAASFSQADSFSVWSKSESSQHIAGMRLDRATFTESARGEILDISRVDRRASFYESIPDGESGTVVRWSDLRSVLRSSDPKARTAWLSQVIASLSLNLGLVFHRIIEEDAFEISIDVYDVEALHAGPPRLVEATDPFAFRVSGAPGFPAEMTARIPSGDVTMEAHLLPPKTESASARLLGRPRTESQGFFVYRNRRLLQAGGWNNVQSPRRDLQLARVKIDVDDQSSRYIRINSEKQGVEFLPDFSRAIESARAESGVTFAQYLQTAQSVLKASQARRKELPPVAPLGKGFHPRVRKKITSTFPVDPSREPVNIRWGRVDDDAFFRLDLHASTIWLNQKYRHRLTGLNHGGANDAPILKTSLFLLLQQFLSKQWLQNTTVEQLDAWQETLNLAADVELDIWEDGD